MSLEGLRAYYCPWCSACLGTMVTTCEMCGWNPSVKDGRMPRVSGGLATKTPSPGMPSIGGGPTRATTLPTDAEGRKTFPVASGVLDYFPDAIAAISHLSWKGNEQHNPGQPLHWARGKSMDEADTLMRHFLQRGTFDSDGIRHSVKVAWRALAMLQKEIEGEQSAT